MVNRTFYTLLVESEESKEESFVQVFWTWADHVGSAIDSVLNVARQEHIVHPFAREIDPYDFETLPENVYEINKTGVFTLGIRHYYPTTPCFKPPEGVIESALEGDFDAEDLQPGFRAYINDEAFHCIDIVLPQEELQGTFQQIVQVLPDIRVSWVEILAEWEQTETRQFWANEALNNVDSILTFLHVNEQSILRNGLVKFTVYCEEGATNLFLSEHKDIGIITTNQRIHQMFVEILTELNISRTDALKSLCNGFYHWHYRPKGSLKRHEFIEYLTHNGFSLWQEIEVNHSIPASV